VIKCSPEWNTRDLHNCRWIQLASLGLYNAANYKLSLNKTICLTVLILFESDSVKLISFNLLQDLSSVWIASVWIIEVPVRISESVMKCSQRKLIEIIQIELIEELGVLELMGGESWVSLYRIVLGNSNTCLVRTSITLLCYSIA